MKLQKIICVNPANYEVIGEIAISSRAEITTKVARARAAQPAWGALSVKKRVSMLEPVYEQFARRRNEIGSLVTKEMGMPASVRDEMDIDVGLRYMRGYLDNAEQWLAPEIVFENEREIHMLYYEPQGVGGASIPWNYPFCNFIWGVMQNLVVGNTVICKHSEECSLTGKLLEEIMTPLLPDGVFNEVYGDGADVGESVMNSAIDILYFTGSTRVGRHLYQVAAQKSIPAILELGGSAPGVVFDDADLELTIKSIYFYRFVNGGQSCDALKRLIVQKSCYDEVMHKLKAFVTSKKVGDPEDPATDIGPLAAERQVVSLEAQVADAIKKGAQIIIGGKRPARLVGAYYEPTILTNISFDMRVWQEEVFGPVLPVVTFDSEDEAIALANKTSYGLGGYIYSTDKERILRVARQLKTGNISVNNVNYVIAEDAFGGYKADSGVGREHGKLGLREFCNAKLVAMNK